MEGANANRSGSLIGRPAGARIISAESASSVNAACGRLQLTAILDLALRPGRHAHLAHLSVTKRAKSLNTL